MSKIYYVQKEGVYFHGVFNITYDLQRAKDKADELATAAGPNAYHSFDVYEYATFKGADNPDKADHPSCNVYTGRYIESRIPCNA